MGKHRKPDIPDAMRDYPTGYRKPPAKSQFKVGNDANPRGRPRKKLKTQAELFNEILQEKVSVFIDGKKKFISKEEYIMRNIVQNAMKGDLKSISLVTNLSERFRADPNHIIDPSTFEEADRAILDRYVQEANQGNKIVFDHSLPDIGREFK